MASRKEQVVSIMESLQVLKHRLMAHQSLLKHKTITPMQRVVLVLVARSTTTNVKDVAKTFHMTSSAATQLVDQLVKQGLLVRKQDTKDRRSVTLSLSTKAHKNFAHMKEQGVERALIIFKALTDKELATYAKLNKKISTFLRTDKTL